MSSNEQIQKYHFDCGCSFEITNPNIKECDGFPGIKIDYYNIPLDCPTTWDLVKSGHTKGIFQLETNLGRHWAKQSLPGQISELAALIAIIRPGVLKAMIDGKSMTSHYCDRKNAIDEVVYFHESLEPVLNDTYGLLLFQENSTKIATEIAGFTPQRGEVLRKGLGKGSLVQTQSGPQYIENIKIDKHNKPKILSVDNGKLKYYTIKKVWSNGIKDTLKINTTNGYNISVTNNHEIFTQEGWKDASDLTTEDYVLIPDKYTYKGDDGLNINKSIASCNNLAQIIGHKNCSGSVYTKPITYEKARWLNNIIGSDILDSVLNCEYKFVRISSIQKDKEVEVFDFELEDEPHCGFINGILVHNSIGKKQADTMHKLKNDFIQGSIKVGKVNKEEAEEIFGWIEKGQRYLFCKAHAVGYGFTGYWSAYAKAHFPLHFYTSWLYYSHEKMDPQEEMQLLISDARYFDIDVKPPALNKLLNGDIGHFSLNDGKVYFGIGDIKRIGQSIVDKIIENVKLVEDRLERKIENWSWNDFLIHFSGNITTTAINGIILSGATDYIPGTRQWKLYQYNVWKTLTKKEQEYVRDNCQESLKKSIRKLIDEKPRLSITRKSKLEDLIKTIKNPSSSLDDQPHIVATKETELLGVPLTYTKLDTCENKYIADTTCKEFLDGKDGNMTVAVEIIDSREYIIKKGKMKGEKMMFLAGEDETASIDSFIIFPRSLENKEPFLIKGSTVLLKGKRDNQRKESFIVENVIQI